MLSTLARENLFEMEIKLKSSVFNAASTSYENKCQYPFQELLDKNIIIIHVCHMRSEMEDVSFYVDG